MSLPDRVEELRAQQGWNDASMLSLLEEYLKYQGDDDALVEHFERAAAQENQELLPPGDSKRSFFRTVVLVTVLSEDHEPEFDDLGELARMIEQGPLVGDMTVVEPRKLSGREMADALYAARSEPGFFGLDDEGNDE